MACSGVAHARNVVSADRTGSNDRGGGDVDMRVYVTGVSTRSDYKNVTLVAAHIISK